MSNAKKNKVFHDLSHVLEISRAMVAASDLNSLLGLIVDSGMELLDAQRASLFLHDAEAHQLCTRIAAGVDEIRVPDNLGISGATVTTGKTINVPDAYADDRFNPNVDKQTGFRTRNILSIPLFDYEGGLVGVLQVINKRGGAFDDYDVSLAETLASQAGVAIQRARLIDHFIQKQEMERAMQLAREIQQGLLPKGPPEIDGFDVAGFSKPADETGGDTYDFMPLPDGRWMFTVADATGHGIGPALVIAETRAMLRAITLHGSDISAVLRTANNLLTHDLGDARFVTCFFGILNAAESRLTYASAGHGPMLFYDRAGDEFREENATGLPLGIMGETDYDEIETVDLRSGDLAVITTDGFMEASNPEGEMFGVARMIDLIRENRDRSAEAIIDNLHAALLDFTQGQVQGDDLTAIVIRRK